MIKEFERLQDYKKANVEWICWYNTIPINKRQTQEDRNPTEKAENDLELKDVGHIKTR